VLMEFAINDADLWDGLSPKDSRATHLAVIRALQAARPGMRIVLMTMSPAQGLRGLMRPRLAQYYAGYAELATDSNLGLVDLYPRWRVLPRAARGLQDGLHPTDAAAQALIVPVLLRYLSRLIEADCTSP
jgi:acyl-CoA thioesterase I